jgi:eukaryotic-like serine/threonine-protein kinase
VFEPGTRFGPYEVVAQLAQGGMGEVYKAKDTRLDRTVALKVLPAHLSADVELRRRFEREARAISSLSHPNICTLYDVGNFSGQEFLVMEFLEGETLADRLVRGAMPIEELFSIANDIADALEKAHREGVIHRDLKPGNIVLTRTGAKLLDFGLAKWMPNENSILGRSDAVTERQPLTSEGMVLGTIPYMAPEQLEGKNLDARTDIFAFGAILYEMATGVRAFNAGSNASLIAAIMREEPVPPSRIRAVGPRGLDRIIQTCLAKNPDDRFQSVHDIKLALQLILAGDDPAALPETTTSRSWLVPVVAAALILLFLGGAAIVAGLRRNEPATRYRFTVTPPLGSTFPSLGEGGGLALSPDGRRLVFEATTPEGRTYLWLRALDAEEPEMLEATEGGEYPFWSPDGRSIGFFADGKLKRMDLPNGPPQTLCDAPTGRGGTWSKSGVIVFAPSSKSGLFRVSASGGAPQQITTPSAGVYSHRWPVFVDDEQFLVAVQSQRPSEVGVFAGSLEGGELRRVLPTALGVAFAAPDRLLYVRDHVLLRQRIDLDDLSLEDDPEILADAMVYFTDRAYVPISVAANGTVAYRRNGASNMRVAWYSRQGQRLFAVGEMGEYEGLSLSPDGTRLAFGYFDAKESMNHVALCAATAGAVPRRFTFKRGNQYSPIWSPDGQTLAFSDDHAGVDTLSSKPLTGRGEEQTLLPPGPGSVYAQSWSPDGAEILFRSEDPRNGFEVESLSLRDRKKSTLLSGPADESQAQFSPDGMWVTYTSTESGRPEVYVQPFPATGAKWQVSTGGGDQPRWRRDGKEMYYLAADRRLMAVSIDVPGAFDAHPPRALFETTIPFGDLGISQAYDVSPDGQRFVIAGFDPLSPPSPITVVTGR